MYVQGEFFLIDQNVAQIIFVKINTPSILTEKSIQKCDATSVIFNKLAKANNHPLG
jgi:hypothetical protein